MRITPRLVQIASILVATGYGIACGGSTTEDGTDASTPDGGANDAGSDAPAVGCGGCGCGEAGPPTYVNVTADQACDLLANNGNSQDPGVAFGPACTAYCPLGEVCGLPYQYFIAFAGLNPEAGAPIDAGEDGGDAGTVAYVCPADAGSVTVTCGVFCEGRLTEGYVAPKRNAGPLGDRFAVMAFLEAVSIYAFDRLERELHAHDAPSDLVRDARRARRDEERHTAMMTKLAARHGAHAQMPNAPNPAVTRSLVEIAIENAIEGCVRETYGALRGLIESETATDPAVRKTMRSIAPDECRHAELAWSVHAWAMTKITSDERQRVQRAMNEAIAEIAANDSRATALLFRNC